LEPGAIKLWDSPDKIPQRANVRWENSALVLGDATTGGFLISLLPKSRDAIIRADVRMNPDASQAQICLRYHRAEKETSIVLR